MTEEAARSRGGISLTDGGRLRPEVTDVIRYLADQDVALFFGHASPDEALVLAEEVQRIGFHKAVVDHPYSPIIGLNVDQMRQLTAAGIYLNWTYDELSPLLGVDPQDVVAAIEAVGPEHCLLSSDAGDPVLPHSVESMRLLTATLEAYGLPRAAIQRMAATNPRQIMGLPADAHARAA